MLSGSKKGVSKRVQEEQRRKQDQVDAAAVYEDFVASFEDTGKRPKTWVKGGVVNPDKSASSKGNESKLYKPKSKLAELAATFQSVKEANKDRDDPPSTKKKKEDTKKKSNLEMFKEELKRIQEEREERHKFKKIMRGGVDPGGGENSPQFDRSLRFDPSESHPDPMFASLGGIELTSDETSTNVYIGNINPKMTENQLLELFGRYGPLASIKIMWPRTEEEISRGRNCGFVAFMNRKDGERALNALKGKEICGFEMKLGWGKPVPIPPHPVYIPPALAELTMPPPPSGYPFNAQVQKGRRNRDGRYNRIPPPGSLSQAEMDETLAKATVKVVIPTERNLLCVIHRMVEFVVREGPMFEAMIMNRELNNPLFKFLFENQSPAHIYYRWKLYSILNGDLPYKWRMEEFRMFKGGSWWKPPVMNPYTQGMPDDLVENGEFPTYPKDNKVEEDREPPKPKGKLTDSQRDRLEDMLRELSPERSKIGEAMVWCMDHADSAEEVVDCITESLSILQTPIPKKIARLFLVSDILFNSSAKVPNASFYRKQFQRKLKEIFRDVHDTYDNIDGRLKAEQFKQKVMLCFRAWEDWAIYPNDFLINLQNIFLGLVPKMEKIEADPRDMENPDLDGAPLEDPDLDGAPLLDTSFPGDGERGRGDKMVMKVIKDEPDLDGVPLSEDLDGEPIADKDDEKRKPQKSEQPKFVTSKWETIDETELEAQAMTTSKWDLLEDNEDKGTEEDVDGMPMEEDLDGKEMSEEEGQIEDSESQDGRDSRSEKTPRTGAMSEERRQKLREIELKVMKYQDEIEAGRRSRKPNMTIAQQVEHHRKKLLAKELSDSPVHEPQEPRKRHRSPSPAYRYEDSPRRSKHSKSSPKRRRSRSRSPRRRSSSRSPSRHRRKSKKNKRKD